MYLVPNGTKDAMNIATKQLISKLLGYPLKPFASNHGKKFAGYPDLEAQALIYTLQMITVLGKEDRRESLMA